MLWNNLFILKCSEHPITAYKKVRMHVARNVNKIEDKVLVYALGAGKSYMPHILSDKGRERKLLIFIFFFIEHRHNPGVTKKQVEFVKSVLHLPWSGYEKLVSRM